MSSTLLIPALDGPVTRTDLKLGYDEMNQFRAEGVLIETGETRKNTDATGKAIAGRPAPLYRLSDKGRKRAKRAMKSGS